MPTETTKPMPQDPQRTDSIFPQRRQKRAGVAEQVCGGLIAASILGCVIIAAQRSSGLIEITVTALDKAAEPRDHNLPFVKKKEVRDPTLFLPGFQIVLRHSDRSGDCRWDWTGGHALGLASGPPCAAFVHGVRRYSCPWSRGASSVGQTLVRTELTIIQGQRFLPLRRHRSVMGLLSDHERIDHEPRSLFRRSRCRREVLR